MATEPVIIQITSAGYDTGPFRVYGSGSSGLYALHNIDYPISKTSLLTGTTFDVPDGYSSSIVVQSVEGYSYPFCTTSATSNISSTTSTTSTTTTPAPDCGIITIDNIPAKNYYYFMDTIQVLSDKGKFHWILPIDYDSIYNNSASNIVSWSVQATSSQYNGNSTGIPHIGSVGTSQQAYRVTISSSLNGSDPYTIVSFQNAQEALSSGSSSSLHR
jgi:hypothetical protein